MSDFLGRVGRITEWVVVSNLENRAVNAACDKAQDWWKNRKHKKNDKRAASAGPAPPTPTQSQQAHYPDPSSQYPPPQQASYTMASPPPTSAGYGQLLITVNQVDGLHQWGPLIVTIECNYQRYQIPFKQFQQQFIFPINQFDYDQVLIWIQTEYQQQTIAHGEIPVRILLNNNNNWNYQSQQQQRWIPLRDQQNNPAGQLLISAEYSTNNSSAQQMPGPPPPYSYYS